MTGCKRQVLVVVEDPFLSDALSDFLTEQGYVVDTATSLPADQNARFHAVVASRSALGGQQPAYNAPLEICCKATDTAASADQAWTTFSEPISLPKLLATVGAPYIQ